MLSQSQLEQYYIPLVKRLSQGDWFTSRTSATGLYAAGYPLATPTTQEELRKYEKRIQWKWKLDF